MRPQSRLFPVLVFTLAALLASPVVSAATATWIAGSGNYSNTTAWDVGIVPCNDMTTTWDVVFPAGAYAVTADQDCDVDSLELATGVGLSLPAGTTFTVAGQANFADLVNSVGGVLVAPTAAFTGNRGRVLASAGGSVEIGASSLDSSGSVANATLLQATGVGSAIQLSDVASLIAAYNDLSTFATSQSIRALDQGQIDLSGLVTIAPPARVEDFLNIEVGNGGSIDLSALTTTSSIGGRSLFQVHAGSTMQLPALETAGDAQFLVDGGGQLFVNGAQPASWDTSGISFTANVIAASGSGSLADLSAVELLDAGFNDSSVGVSRHSLLVSDSAAIDLSGLLSTTPPARVEDYLEFDASTGGSFDLSSLATVSGSGGYTYFDTHAGSIVQLPSATFLGDALIQADGGAQFQVNGPQPATYDTSGVPFSVNAITASGVGTVVDLSSIDTLDAGFNDSSVGASRHSLLVSDSASIDLSGLTSIAPPARPEDYLEFDVSTGGSFDLSSLATVSGAGGYTYFDTHAGSIVQLPSATFLGDALIQADGGAQFRVNGPQPATYDTSGVPFTTTTINATGVGTVVDLSSIDTLVDGFDDASTGASRHSLFVSDSASIDLSGLLSTTPPLRTEDYLEFDASTGGSFDLSSLATVSGAGGYTYFDTHAGSIVQLPSATFLGDALIQADGGAQFRVNGPQPATYDTSGVPFTTDAINVSGAGTVVDLSSIDTLVVGFDDANTGASRHRFLATSAASIDLSSVEHLSTPLRFEDRADFQVSGNGTIDLSQLASVSGGGRFRVDADTLGFVHLGDTLFDSRFTIALAAGGSLRAEGIRDGTGTGQSTIELNDADIDLTIGSLDLGDRIAMVVPLAGTPLRIEREFFHSLTAEADLPLEAAVVTFAGSVSARMEIGSEDLGSARPPAANFGVGQLVVGEFGAPTVLQLQDAIDNGNRAGTDEALYLLGLDAMTQAEASGLRLIDGSTLSLECHPVYLFDDDNDATATSLNGLLAAAATRRIAFGSGFIQVGIDSDGDGIADCQDNCPRTANPDQTDSDLDGKGDACDVQFALDDPDVAQPVEGLGLQSASGTAVAAAGDLDGDGIRDFLVGSPGFEPSGGQVQTGAAAIYLGSPSAAERAQPDIVFVGEAALDRAGTAVAGDFDFNGDGRLDILIGAEQTDRSVEPGLPAGTGKVYLIYFDPTDSSLYPNIGNPAVTDTLDLARVGNGLVDEIPGVVFEGSAFGDRLGFSVAGGGRVDAGSGQDLLLGAPGRDVGAFTDAGSAYLIFDTALLSGTVAVDRVANGLGDQIDGVRYEGAMPGDRFGFAVAFPGDVVGTIADDVAIGAPGSDVLATDAGNAYFPEGGAIAVGIVEGCSIGDDKPAKPKGFQIQGTQAGEGLGSSVAGGGDNLVDGEQDSLIGAPAFDRDPTPAGEDAGRVIQLGSKVPNGIYPASAVGAPAGTPLALRGVIWVGAAGGDLFGTAVAGLGDISGDGLDEIGLGAPGADPEGLSNAGILYAAGGFVPPTFALGTIDLAEGFPGTEFIGTQVDEQAGAAVAGPGDVDGDGENDFLVGAPGHDSISVGTGAGRVYVVLECGVGDADLDGLLNCEDNCPSISNPAQSDQDGDGIGDLCDLCPTAADPGQPDSDGDGFPNACDNCPGLSNPSQADEDLDGVGTVCDSNPIFTVSSDPGQLPDFATLQDAINSATESGTQIRIDAGTGCYAGPIVVDRSQVFDIVGDGSGVCIDGGVGAALDIRTSFQATPIRMRNLRLMGQVGVMASASTELTDVDFRDISDVALDLTDGDHRATRISMDSTVVRGVVVGFGASIELDRSRLEGLAGQAVQVDGLATIENTLIADSADGIVVGSAALIDLRHSTVASNGGVGIDNQAAGTVSVQHSIVWGHATADLTAVACTAIDDSLTCTPDCSGINANLCADPLLDAGRRLQSGSPALDRGPDPATFDGTPCSDLDGNPRLIDWDGDGLAQLDLGAFEHANPAATPGPVGDLNWSDSQTMTWDPVPGATEYHVYREATGTLGYDAFAVCRDDLDLDRTDQLLSDASVPVAGVAWYYLVTAEDATDQEGSLGFAACAERSNFSACP